MNNPVIDNQMNLIAIEGTLTCDVSLSYDEKKKSSIARFYIKNSVQMGQNKHYNDYYIVVYGKKAEECAKYLSTGKTCSVTGKSATWITADKKGKQQAGVTIIASDVYYETTDEAPSERCSQ